MSVIQKIKILLENTQIRRIVLLALGLRLVWYFIILFTNPDGFWLYDSNGYWNIAYNMKEFGMYSRDAQAPLLPDYFRTPLYPFMIYPTLWLDPSGNCIPIIHIVLDCITCYLIYKILLVFSSRELYAKTGALVYALHIPAIVTSNYILTESIFAFLICLFTWYVLCLVKQPGFKYAVLVGLVGGLGVMCKPLGFVLIFPTVVFFLFYFRFHYRSVLPVTIVVICFYLVQFPWMLRNKYEFGRYFNSVIGEHLLLGYHTAYIYSKAHNVEFSYAQDLLRGKFDQGLNYDPYKHPYEYAKLIEQESYKILWENKWLFVQAHSIEVGKFFIWPMGKYAGAQLGLQKPYTPYVVYLFLFIQLVVSLLIYLSIGFYLVACFRFKHKPPMFWIFLVGVILLFSQFTTMPYTDARMRFPMDPLLIIVAISSLWLWRKFLFIK